ncbi:MAG: hypothetical protein FJ316_03540 [SAR202 cluster bacterium]|nr:hypothetical protein [SAR202 cluster bacterium]
MRSTSSKWLVGAALVIAALIIASVAVALFNRSREQTLFPEDSPTGVVQRYLLAIQEEDTRKAYDYLGKDLRNRCTYDHFRESTRWLVRQDSNDSRDTQVALEGERAVNDGMEVRVRITEFNVSAPFNVNEYSHNENYLLKKEDGAWKFVGQPWPMGWCPEPPKTP